MRGKSGGIRIHVGRGSRLDCSAGAEDSRCAELNITRRIYPTGYTVTLGNAPSVTWALSVIAQYGIFLGYYPTNY